MTGGAATRGNAATGVVAAAADFAASGPSGCFAPDVSGTLGAEPIAARAAPSGERAAPAEVAVEPLPPAATAEGAGAALGAKATAAALGVSACAGVAAGAAFEVDAPGIAFAAVGAALFAAPGADPLLVVTGAVLTAAVVVVAFAPVANGATLGTTGATTGTATAGGDAGAAAGATGNGACAAGGAAGASGAGASSVAVVAGVVTPAAADASAGGATSAVIVAAVALDAAGAGTSAAENTGVSFVPSTRMPAWHCLHLIVTTRPLTLRSKTSSAMENVFWQAVHVMGNGIRSLAYTDRPSVPQICGTSAPTLPSGVQTFSTPSVSLAARRCQACERRPRCVSHFGYDDRAMNGFERGRVAARHDWAPGLITLTVDA